MSMSESAGGLMQLQPTCSHGTALETVSELEPTSATGANSDTGDLESLTGSHQQDRESNCNSDIKSELSMCDQSRSSSLLHAA